MKIHRVLIINILLIIGNGFLLTRCEMKSIENNSIDKKNLIGLWQSSNKDFFIFNDSLCIVNYFTPYTKWKIKKDTIYIYKPESRQVNDSIWIPYKINLLTQDTLSLFNPLIEDKKMILLRKKEKRLAGYKGIKLKGLWNANGKPDFEFYVNLINGETRGDNLSRNNENNINNCVLDSLELNTIYTILNEVSMEDIKSTYISNIMDSRYFSLELYNSNGQLKWKTIIDTGDTPPKSLQKLVTYIWATTKLKCFTDDYLAPMEYP